MQNDTSKIPEFIQSYEYFFNYSDLLKYELSCPNTLTKEVIVELTRKSETINGTSSDIIYLLSKYNEIKANVLTNISELPNLFISKINSFYQKSNENFVTETSLPFIIPIIEDNYSVNCNLINDIIYQANEYIDKLDQNAWFTSLKISENSLNIKLLIILNKYNLYKNEKLPKSANDGYSDFIKLSYKEKIIPLDIEFWNIFLKNFLLILQFYLKM